jgi:DNA polymerase elongation subunit (family B)|uniref:Truncated plasmid-related DNA polymerase n=2 Tax=Glomeraceae TaxID=36751 RepID=A0A140GAX0_9GLOM|nr:truncated plasmid-related DNA polymerase [Glomus sp. DAOM 240422]AMM72605.1 truncated plasmid-related DNA polymerase [Rhizophagus irregularis]
MNGKGGDSNLIKEYTKGLTLRTNVALASAVTAYSRMIINDHKLTALNSGANLYYSDTDSMVIDQELDSSKVDPAKLGYLKLEHTIEEGIFPLPKEYYLRTTEGHQS